MMCLSPAVRRGLRLMSAVLIAVPCVLYAKDAAPPDLSGIWKLNESKSERLEDNLAELRPSMGGGMGAGRGRRGGMGGGRARMGGGEGPPEGMGRRGDGGPPTFAKPPKMMVLDQSDSAVVVSENGNVLRTLILNGEMATGGSSARVPAHWNGRILQAESQDPAGRKIEEAYTLASDSLSLSVRVTAQGPQGTSIVLTRVYDRYDGSE